MTRGDRKNVAFGIMYGTYPDASAAELGRWRVLVGRWVDKGGNPPPLTLESFRRWDEYRNPRDPHADQIIPAPEPCPHGNGSRCDCQLPHYAGIYVAPITFKDGKVRHILVRARMTHDGGMREFTDPVTGEVVGSCGLHFWLDGRVQTLAAWAAEDR